MRLKNFFLLTCLLGLAWTGYLFALSTGPDPGFNGVFGATQTCATAGCHSGNPLNQAGGSVTISGLPAAWLPNQAYPLVVSVQRPGQSRFGFQLSAVANGTNQQAGTLTPGAGVRIVTGSGIQFAEHSNANSTSSFNVTWTAPASAVGTIRFNLAGNAANGDLTNNGDFIYTRADLVNAAAPPQITANPQTQSIVAGQTAALSVGATGDEPLTYQWYTGLSGTTSDPVGGATQSTYITPPLNSTTNYWVQVSNPSGTANSATTTITVIQPPQISVQPQNQIINSGQTAALSVTATGSEPLGYQWYIGPSGTTSNPIGGANASSYTTPSLTTTTSYWVRVSNAGGTLDSSTATITVILPPPTFTAIAPNAGGKGVSLPVTLTGTNFAPGMTVSPITGVSVGNINVESSISATATFSINVGATLGPRNVTVTTTGGTSGAVTFTVLPAPPTLSNLSLSSARQGSNATLTLTGTNFADPLTVSAGSNITVGDVVIVNSTTATATLAIASNAAIGARDLIATGVGGSSAPAPFTVTAYTTKPCAPVSPGGNVQASSSTFADVPGSSVTAGQYVRITATGCVGIDNTGGVAAPEGSWRGAASGQGILSGQPLHGLVCKVGAGTPFYVGRELLFTAVNSGTVSCIVNENSSGGAAFADNSGFWTVAVASVGGQQPCATVTNSGNLAASASTFTDIAGAPVLAGHVMLIEASGCVTVDGSGNASPAGSWRVDAAAGAVVAGKPLHGLACRIGTGAPFYVGSSLFFTAAASGTLSCIVNEEPFSAGSFADNSGKWTVSVFDVNGRDDLTVNFGAPFGTWTLYNNSQWALVHGLQAERMASGDFDGNGKTDVVFDFGPPYGIWGWYNNSSWTLLHPLSAVNMVAGDLDGNGQTDLVVDLAPYGLWVRYNNTAWTKIHDLPTSHMTLGDLDGNGQSDLIVDFGAVYGLWFRYNNAVWSNRHPLSAKALVTGDLTGDGKIDLVVDFGPPFGLWVWQDNASWLKLHDLSIRSGVAADLDGNGQADLVVDLAPYGIWIRYNNNGAWTKIHDLASQNMAAGDLDGDGKADLIIDFPGFGIFGYYNSNLWRFLHPLSSTSMMIRDTDRN